VNGPDGTSVAAQAQSPPSSKEPSPAPPASGSVSNPNTDKVNIVFRLRHALIEFVQIAPC
jgi:hypothetical protein